MTWLVGIALAFFTDVYVDANTVASGEVVFLGVCKGETPGPDVEGEFAYHVVITEVLRGEIVSREILVSGDREVCLPGRRVLVSGAPAEVRDTGARMGDVVATPRHREQGQNQMFYETPGGDIAAGRYRPEDGVVPFDGAEFCWHIPTIAPCPAGASTSFESLIDRIRVLTDSLPQSSTTMPGLPVGQHTGLPVGAL